MGSQELHNGQEWPREGTANHPIMYHPARLGPGLSCPSSGLSQSRVHPRSLDKQMGHLEAVGARVRWGTQGLVMQGQGFPRPGPSHQPSNLIPCSHREEFLLVSIHLGTSHVQAQAAVAPVTTPGHPCWSPWLWPCPHPPLQPCAKHRNLTLPAPAAQAAQSFPEAQFYPRATTPHPRHFSLPAACGIHLRPSPAARDPHNTPTHHGNLTLLLSSHPLPQPHRVPPPQPGALPSKRSSPSPKPRPLYSVSDDIPTSPVPWLCSRSLLPPDLQLPEGWKAIWTQLLLPGTPSRQERGQGFHGSLVGYLHPSLVRSGYWVSAGATCLMPVLMTVL